MGTVLVSGGAGFIGSHLCERLLNDGYEVICIDNLITGDKNNINYLLQNPKFAFINKDIIELAKHESADKIQNVNYIFHLASPASPNIKSPRSYIKYPIETLLVNSKGTHNLLELAKNNQAKFLYASSSEVYGDPLVSPQSETYFGNVNTNGIRSVYDEGKRFGEAIVMAYVRKYNLDCCIARIFNTYGPKMQRDDGRVVSNFITQSIANKPITIYGDGKQTRSFCYITDMIEGLARLMFGKDTKGQVVNLGNPDERAILTIARMIKTLTGSDSKIVFEDLPVDDPKSRRPDVTKAKQLLKWSAQVELEEGLQKTIEYFKSV